MLGIVPSCKLVKYQGKLMIQTWGNGEKVNVGEEPILAPPSPKFFVRFAFLDIVPSYYPMELKRRLIYQIWLNSKKLNFGPILSRLVQIWTPNFFSGAVFILFYVFLFLLCLRLTYIYNYGYNIMRILMFCQIFLWTQVKQNLIISNKLVHRNSFLHLTRPRSFQV